MFRALDTLGKICHVHPGIVLEKGLTNIMDEGKERFWGQEEVLEAENRILISIVKAFRKKEKVIPIDVEMMLRKRKITV